MILGTVDYSLTSPCICIYTGLKKEFTFNQCKFYFLTDKKKYANNYLNNIKGELFDDYDSDCMRYDTISDWAMRYLIGCEQVGIEGYSYGSKGQVFSLAENCGLLKFKLWETRIPVTIIPPSTMKKFVSGKGNATKEDLYAAFSSKTNLDLATIITPDKTGISNPVTDIIDSYYLLQTLLKSIED